ncbi:MAG: CoA-binding protein [Spirosomataceae bacterium]
MKKTLIIGASTNPTRYSFLAANRLVKHGHEIVQIGRATGQVAGEAILTGKPELPHDIDTVTLYISPQHQAEWYDYVLTLQPKRVIFNPGTENPDFENLLESHHIEALEACTLVLLSIGNY